jgi:hypothetical protein
MESDHDQRKTSQTTFNWAHFGLGCFSGVILSITCFLTIAIPLIGWSIFVPAQSYHSTGELDVSVEISVQSDGCTVTRTDVEGATPISNLQWVVMDASGEQVLGRAAEGEVQYTYYRSGEYRVYLVAWHAGEYVQISNEVIINCP